MASICIASPWNLPTGVTHASLPHAKPNAGAAASFVYRSFELAARPPMPSVWQRHELAQQLSPTPCFSCFAKTPGSIARDFKWLGSYRYGIVHLGGHDAHDLRARCEAASRLLGWPHPAWLRTRRNGNSLRSVTPNRVHPTVAGDFLMRLPFLRNSAPRLRPPCSWHRSLGSCGPMGAQNPSGRLKPVNAVAEGEDSRVMLKGADVVAYFTQGKFVAGQSAVQAACTRM
jgi:hypothetical protein